MRNVPWENLGKEGVAMKLDVYDWVRKAG
jgi:hypothetical protein